MCLGMLHIKFHMVKCMLKSPFLEMSKSWHFYGPNMVLRISSLWVLINVPRDASSQISHCWVYLIAYPARNVQIIALLCPKHGLRFFFPIGSFWVLMSVPRDASCHISHYWVYPVARLARNVKIMAHLWPKRPFMALTWPIHGPSNLFFLILNQSAQGCFMPNFTLLGVSYCILCQKCSNHGPFMAKT